MKSIITILFALVPFFCVGQNLQLEKSSEELKFVFETETHPSDNVMNFIYAEAVITDNKAETTYLQIFREQKWWDAPVLLHAEFRTFLAENFCANNVYLGGVAFQVINKHNKFLTLEALYRYDDKNNWQATAAYGVFWQKLSFSGYADFYGTNKLYLCSENKLFYKLTNNIQIGTNIEIGLNIRENKEFSCYPFAVLRLDM